jgi:3-hydroxyisobutyrate dehydrogenase-like beta-hydroxyacid dehydrogenase
MIKNVAVVGVGLMGSSLAKHLLGAGYAVTVHDADPAKVAALVALGAQKAVAADRLAAGVDAVMFSLPNSDIVEDVVHNSLKLMDTGREGLLVIDCSTADPEKSRKLGEQLAGRGMSFLDATISGTSEMFAVKDAIFMVGGTESAFGLCRPLFAAAARESYHIGPNGTGGVAKLVINMVLSLNRFALAEGLTLAKKAGLDQPQILKVLQDSAAYSKAMDQKGERMIHKRFKPPASEMSTSYKDARLILALGAQFDCPLPMMSLATQIFASEAAKGHTDRDPATIIEFYNEIANL